jgi:TP901 family phage tail tape measure protein
VSDLRRLYVELATNVRPLVAGMAQGSVAVKKLGKDIGGLGADMDRLSAKATESSRRVVEAQKRMEAAQARLNTLRSSGRASVQQQASAEASLIAAERNLARAHTQAADASKAASGGMNGLTAAGSTTKDILSKVALVSGVTLAAGLLASANAALQLEQRLYNVASISPEVASDMGRYRELIVSLSTELPQSANDLSEGFYNIVSSGFQANDAIEVLTASARAAAAGLTSTETAATAISAVINAYGLSASDAADISDVLFETVNKGVINFDQLAQGVGDYVGTGAAAKVSIGELGAAVAAMTLSGVTAAESGTSLNRVLQSIVQPSDALAEALKNAGYESGAAALEADGLHGVMEKLRTATGGNVEQLLTLFPEMRAARGAFALMAADGKNYTNTFESVATVNGRVGATQHALAEQQKSGSYQITVLKNQATALGIEMGQTLLPAIKFIVGGFHDFFAMVRALPGPVMAVVTVLAALSAAALLGVGAFIRYRAPVAQFRASLAAMRAEGSALPGVLTGVTIAAAAVAAAMIIGTIIYGEYASAKAKAKQATEDFTAALKSEQQGQKDAVMTSAIDQMVKNGSAERLKKYGLDISDYLKGILGSEQDYQRERDAMSAAQRNAGPGHVNDFIELAGSLNQMRGSLGDARLGLSLQAEAQKDASAATKQALGPLADLDAAQKNASGAAVELSASQKGLRDTLTGLVDDAAAAKDALTGLTDPAKVLSKVQQDANAPATEAAGKSKDEIKAQNQKELYAAQDRVRSVRNGTKAQKQAAQDNLTEVRRANKARTDALKGGNADAQVTLDQWIVGLRTSARQQAQWEADLTTVARRAGPNVASALRQMGADAIPIVHELATGTKAQVAQVKSALDSLAPEARHSLQAFTAELAKQVTDQAAFVGNLVSLAARGHLAVAQELEKLPMEQAVPLAAQAANSSDKQLAPLEATLKRRAAIAGDGTTEALAAAVESGMQVVTLAASNGAQAAVDALVQRFGDVDQAVLFLDNLRTAITDVTGRHVIDVVLNLLTTQGQTRVGPLPQPGRQGHSRDSDFLPSGGGAAAPAAAPKAGSASSPATRDQHFADGGLRDAQIQPGRGRGMFQWAEASTGGEAFIPLGASKRQRSTRILHTVARQFGMAMVPAAGVRSFAAGGVTIPAQTGGVGVVRLATEDVERVAMALSRLLPRVQKTEFSGPIHGYDLEAVRRDAERQTRLNSLKGI